MIVNFPSRFPVIDILCRFIPKMENFTEVLKDKCNYKYSIHYIHSNTGYYILISVYFSSYNIIYRDIYVLDFI